MLALPNDTAATVFGTNKGSSVFGTLNATWRYSRKIALPWKTLLLPASLAAFVFAFIGAAVVTWLPKETVRPLVLVLLIAVWLCTVLQPDFGKTPGRMTSRPLLAALMIGSVIGFYDGFFGPGTGSFLIFAFVRFFGLDFLAASASAKVVNATTNIAALAYFIPHGQIIWPIVAVMAVGNVAGAGIGSRLALKHGSGFVRGVFLLVVTVLICRLSFDTLSR